MVNIAEQTSLAQQLASSGFRKTSMARAFAELAESYIRDPMIDRTFLDQLQATTLGQLQTTNFQAWRILQDQPIWESSPANLQFWELQQLVPELKKAA